MDLLMKKKRLRDLEKMLEMGVRKEEVNKLVGEEVKEIQEFLKESGPIREVNDLLYEYWDFRKDVVNKKQII